MLKGKSQFKLNHTYIADCERFGFILTVWYLYLLGQTGDFPQAVADLTNP